MPFFISRPFSLTNSGKIMGRRPVLSSNLKPTEGLGDKMILFSSSTTRSMETILIRSACSVIASKVLSSIRKSSCVAKRMARIMRSGSSEKVIPGSSGVRMILLAKSSSPSKGSSSSPKRSLFSESASALMVKSRRFWSSSNETLSGRQQIRNRCCRI